MKQTNKNNASPKKQSIHIRVNKRLDKYDNKVLFPKKLARANKLLKDVKIPK